MQPNITNLNTLKGNALAFSKSTLPSFDSKRSIYAVDSNGAPVVITSENKILPLANSSKTFVTHSIRGVSDQQGYFLGDMQEIAQGLTGNYIIDTPMNLQHLYIKINSVTSGGDIVITGTNCQLQSVTETITIDTETDVHYITENRFVEITNIDVSDTTGLNYNLGDIEYYNFCQNLFAVNGCRFDIKAQGNAPEIRVTIEKVKDLGGKKFTFETLEDILFDTSGTNQIVNFLRGTSFAPVAGKFWEDGQTIQHCVCDYNAYFAANGENTIDSYNKREGLMIYVEGAEGNPCNHVDFLDVILDIKYYYTGETP